MTKRTNPKTGSVEILSIGLWFELIAIAFSVKVANDICLANSDAGVLAQTEEGIIIAKMTPSKT